MSQSEDTATGIPTRLIHESYVEMMQAITTYYRADQEGTGQHIEQAHARVQQRVLGFFEVLRPYLRTKNSVEDYWAGEIPDYDDDTGTAILASQTRNVPVSTEYLDQAADREWQEMPMDWLEEQVRANHPELNGNSRIEAVHHEPDQGTLLLKVRQYQVGLKQLDGKFHMQQTQVQRGSGYMRHESSETTVKKKLPIKKLFNAAHALEEAAESLGMLSNVDDTVPQTEITQEMIDDVEEWRQNKLET